MSHWKQGAHIILSDATTRYPKSTRIMSSSPGYSTRPPWTGNTLKLLGLGQNFQVSAKSPPGLENFKSYLMSH